MELSWLARFQREQVKKDRRQRPAADVPRTSAGGQLWRLASCERRKGGRRDQQADENGACATDHASCVQLNHPARLI